MKLGFLIDTKECVWMVFQHSDKFGAKFRRGRCLDQFYFWYLSMIWIVSWAVVYWNLQMIRRSSGQ